MLTYFLPEYRLPLHVYFLMCFLPTRRLPTWDQAHPEQLGQTNVFREGKHVLVIPHKQPPVFQEVPVFGQGANRLEAFLFDEFLRHSH